ncbi:hypothetical protein [Mycobacterium sp. ENV421]|uniref:hypothetical protein n=1 Tax=Mycobacterium sp. ENV421 TaxID=1213407 RepID=UPI0011594F34|nr:hypothetical protein [Mycobacterium sp. ENV421]
MRRQRGGVARAVSICLKPEKILIKSAPMRMAPRQSVCALGISAVLIAGVVAAPPAVTTRAEPVHVVRVSDVTLAAVSSASPTATAVNPAGLVLVALVKTFTFVELWAIVAVDIVAAPVLAPLYWFASSFIGWGPRNPVDAISRYLDVVAQDVVRAIQYPFTGISGAAAATGDNNPTSAPVASQKSRSAVSTSDNLGGRDLPRAGTGKGHSALAVRRGASTPTASTTAGTRKTATSSTAEHRSPRGHGARVHANSRDD